MDMKMHLNKLFLIIVLLSCFTCFQRADYNLPLFTFAYFLWEFRGTHSQKTRLFYLFVSTWIVDFIWLIYWGITWGSAEYKQNGSTGASGFVLALSIISFLVKLATIILTYVYEEEARYAVSNFVTNAKNILNYSPDR